jgi:hypothetical protein
VTSPGRYHLLLTANGRPLMHGWWKDKATARDRFRDWIGERGSMPGARIVLVDEETAEELDSWPEEA